MDSPYGGFVLSGVSIRASPNLEILGVKFDSKLAFESHVRGIVTGVSQRICILRTVKLIFVDTFVLLRCYFAFVLPILEYCSSVWGSAAQCHLQLLERRCIRCPGFGLIRVSCRCIIDGVLRGLVCCTRLKRTLITACSASFHLLLLEFDIPEPSDFFISFPLFFMPCSLVSACLLPLSLYLNSFAFFLCASFGKTVAKVPHFL